MCTALSGKTVDAMETMDTHPIQEHSEWGHSPEEITCDLRSEGEAGIIQVRRRRISTTLRKVWVWMFRYKSSCPLWEAESNSQRSEQKDMNEDDLPILFNKLIQLEKIVTISIVGGGGA